MEVNKVEELIGVVPLHQHCPQQVSVMGKLKEAAVGFVRLEKAHLSFSEPRHDGNSWEDGRDGALALRSS